MKSFATAAALVSLVPSILALTINTPANIVQCQPTLLQWDGGSPPYFLSAIPAKQPSAPAIKTFPTQNGTSFTWNVDLATGSSITLSLKDGTGAQAFSDVVTVNNSSDSSCVDASVEITQSGGAATTAGATSGSPAATSTGTGTTTPSQTNTKTSGTPSATKSSAAFKSSTGAYGLAGVLSMIGLAML